jgi:hypothetical protein
LDDAGIERDLGRIEEGLRELKLRYDQFLAGALDREPFELRQEIDALIRRWRHSSIQRYAHKFRLNTLVSRYTSYTELWSRQVRAAEEGRSPTGRTGAEDENGNGVRTLLSTRLSGGENDPALLRELHRAYLDANRRLTGRTAPVDYSDFYRQLAGQARGIRQKNGCDAVEFRLVYDGRKVRLRARPGGRSANAPVPEETTP